MRIPRNSAFLGLFGACLAGIAFSCAGGNRLPGDAGTTGGPPAGSGGGVGGGTASSGSGSGTGGGGIGGFPPMECHACSADLHDILDCDGNVVATCPPDQGCAAGVCVPACQAAVESRSSIGCEFYALPPDAVNIASGACYAVVVANTWTTPITLTISRGTKIFPTPALFVRMPSGSGPSLTYQQLPNGELPPGEVAIAFLSREGGVLCPPGVFMPFVGDPAVHGTGRGAAFRVKTSAPAIAYDIYPFGGGPGKATSATLLLPTSVWGTNYVAVDAYEKSTLVASAQPSMGIVAAEDATTVTLLPSVAVEPGDGVQGGPAGVPLTYTMNRGEILQFTQDAELIGSPIQSDKPIGVWAASTCLSIAVDKGYCDTAHQQIPPVAALGSEYVAVRYRNRFDGVEESPPWRLVGAVDGTNLVWSPALPPGAPTSLSLGQVAEFRAPGPFVVRSQDDAHPFYVAGYMTGCTELNPAMDDCRGDPEFVNVTPPAQYLRRYTFFADPTYPETNLVVTRRKLDGVFHDVTLDCAGPLAGWIDIAGTDFQYTHFDLVRGDFEPQGQCDNGRREMHSDAPFGLTVWGWGSAATTTMLTQSVSYAYPAGVGVRHINDVVIDPVP